MAQSVAKKRGTAGSSEIKRLLEETESIEELRERGVEEPGQSSLSKDEIFEVLSNRRRRQIIRFLQDQDGRSTTSELAEYIAAVENDTSVPQLTSSQRKRVYVGLYQNHLPRMDELGVIEYAKNRGTVRLRDAAADTEPYLRASEQRPYHLAPPVGGFLGATGILVGLIAPLQVPEFVVLGLGVVLLVGLVTIDVVLNQKLP